MGYRVSGIGYRDVALGARLVLAALVSVSARAVVGQTNASASLPELVAGTNWNPRSVAMDGRHLMRGDWMLMLHGTLTAAYVRERGPRGDDGVYALNMVMLQAARSLGRGALDVRTMLSAEPAMGKRGYPLLLQTGESADGATPLFDRQHPHDLVMELSATYRFAIDTGLALFAYAAPVGSPAFGPVPFMHRASGAALLRAPVSHHVQDGSHITNGVITLGVVSERRVKIEGSLFNGLEPDEKRWDIEAPRFESYAVRVSALAGRDWAFQASVAQVVSPERLHPGIDVTRLSASVTHNHAFTSGNWQTTFVYGRAKTKRTEIPIDVARATFSAPVLSHYLALIDETGIPEDSLVLFFPVRTQPAMLIESALERGRWTIAARYETVTKTELFTPTDTRHSESFNVAHVEVALARELLRTRIGSLSIGVAGSMPMVPRSLEADYGSSTASMHGFARFVLR